MVLILTNLTFIVINMLRSSNVHVGERRGGGEACLWGGFDGYETRSKKRNVQELRLPLVYVRITNVTLWSSSAFPNRKHPVVTPERCNGLPIVCSCGSNELYLTREALGQTEARSLTRPPSSKIDA